MTIGLKNSHLQEYTLRITVAIISRVLRALTETGAMLIWDNTSIFQFPIGKNLLRTCNVKCARKHKQKQLANEMFTKLSQYGQVTKCKIYLPDKK
jgi:hypothetical protein